MSTYDQQMRCWECGELAPSGVCVGPHPLYRHDRRYVRLWGERVQRVDAGPHIPAVHVIRLRGSDVVDVAS